MCSTQRWPIHRVQLHDASNRDTHLYPPHSNSSVFLTTTTYVRRSRRIINGTQSGWKTSYVQMRNGRSLQHPKQISARRSSIPLEGQFLCCALSVLAIALYKNFPQNVCVSSSFWSLRKRRHGPCMYVCMYKWGMASSAACECGAEQAVDHVVLHCPIHQPPQRTTRPDGSGRWDNWMAAQHLPWYLNVLAVDKRRTGSIERRSNFYLRLKKPKQLQSKWIHLQQWHMLLKIVLPECLKKWCCLSLHKCDGVWIWWS